MSNRIQIRLFGIIFLFVISASFLFAQAPVNDNCDNPTEIIIPQDGFGLGSFIGDTVEITNATQQFGEFLYFPLFRKTVWYRFKISTHRKLVVSVWEYLPGTGGLAATDVAFTLFKMASCLPGDPDRASQISPINIMGSTSDNPCMPPGEYLLQVGVKQNTPKGFIYPRIDIARPSTISSNDFYDKSEYLGTLSSYFNPAVTWNCMSMDEKAELCPQLGADSSKYTKSAWYTFTTDNFIDLLQFQLTNTEPYAMRFFEGDIRNTPFSSLKVIRDCERHNSYDYINISCEELKPNTVYSVQFIAHFDNNSTSNIQIRHMGEGLTQAPIPNKATFPASNQFGTISPGNNYLLTDYLSCNARLTDPANVCGTVNPDSGIISGSQRYSLTTWFDFTLTQASHIYFTASVFSAALCNYEYRDHGMIMRLFSKKVDGSCSSIDLSDLYRQAKFNSDGTVFISCLPAGEYSLQVLGKDPYWRADRLSCNNNQLGTRLKMNIKVELVGSGEYTLSAPNDIDKINSGNQLALNTNYNADPAPFSCVKTVLPDTIVCNPVADRAVFREFTIGDGNNDGKPDSGMVTITNANYRTDALNRLSISLLYAGSANSLAAAQNKYNYPDKLKGLDPLAGCPFYNSAPYGPYGWDYIYTTQKYCLLPGKYTLLTFGDSTEIGLITKPIFNWQMHRSKFDQPEKAENLGDVIASGLTVTSQRDTFTCKDNAQTIAGLSPCGNSTKLIYREFYLSQDAAIRVDNLQSSYSSIRIFKGRASDGIGSLSPAPYTGANCYGDYFNSPGCTTMPAGWYTVVSYGSGANYDNNFPYHNMVGHSGMTSGGWSIGQPTTIRVIADTTVPPGPFYNRPYKACVANNDQALVFQNNGTPGIPSRTATYTLCTENFRPQNDLPFSSHPIDSCSSTERVAYYVFNLGEYCQLRITGISGYYKQLYKLDVRTDSTSFPGANQLITCGAYGNDLQVCQLDPGVYTLCVFGTAAQNCVSFTPTITIDDIGYSRFDYAKNAYDFGVVPPDGNFHGGKVGDSHPYFPSELNASADVFYCTTGAASTDPTSDCSGSFYSYYAPIYPNEPNHAYYNEPGTQPNANRRNLWYTFVVEGPGTVQIKVNNLTKDYNPSRKSLVPFQVFQSDVDATIPFANLHAMGELDSTIASGLSFIVSNHPYVPYSCGTIYPTATVDRLNLLCANEIVKTRYYVLVDLNEGSQRPVLSVDVEIKFMPIPNVSQGAPYDFISKANHIGLNEELPPYTPVVLDYDTEYKGAWGDLTCATVDAADQTYNEYYYACPGGMKKSVWYKFTLDKPGQILTNFDTKVGNTGAPIYYQLIKRLHPDDSVLTSSGSYGAQILNYLSPAYPYNGWRQYCLVPGEYYLWFGSCYAGDTNQIQPRILFRNNPGDYCMSAISGSTVTTGVYSLKTPVNCQTIGTDFAEDGTNEDCIGSPTRMRTSWFVFTYDGPDTVNFKVNMITAGLFNYGSPTNIRMRQYYGTSCASLISTYCWNDFFTINEIPCIPPTTEGNLYLQVIYPDNATGEIGVKIEIIPNPTPGCDPFDPIAIDVDFDFNKSCYSDSIKFTNYSSSGPNITYDWDFGIPGATSKETSPTFEYPPTQSGVIEYPVRLIAHNLEAGVSDTIVKMVPIGAGGNPFELGGDTAICTNQTISLEVNLLNAFCFWSTGETSSEIQVSTPGRYSVRVNYNGCDYYDTIQVSQVPLVNGLGNDTTLCKGESIRLSPPPNGSPPPGFQWSTGAVDTAITVSTTGTYWLKLSRQNCSIIDTIHINVLDLNVNLGNDTLLCIGDTLRLMPQFSPAIPMHLLSWSEGPLPPLPAMITQPGKYWLRIDSSGCFFSDTLKIDTMKIHIQLPDSTILCYGGDVLLKASSGVAVDWLWKDGSIKSDTIVNNTGLFRIEANYHACHAIDSVRVYLQDDRFSLGNDTIICSYNELLLFPPLPEGTVFKWNDGSSGPSLIAKDTGTYWLEAERNGCIVSDTLVLGVTNLQFTLGPDTSLCEGQSFRIRPVVPPGVHFTWSDQSTAPDFLVTTAGMISLTVDSAGCSWTETRRIQPNPLPKAIIEPLPNPICLNDCIEITENSQFAKHWKWVINDTLTFLEQTVLFCAREYQTYPLSLIATNHCGSDTAETAFTVYQPDIRVISDTTVLAGDTVLLWAEGASTYLWEPIYESSCSNCGHTYGNFTEDKTFYLFMTDSAGCPAKDTVDIKVVYDFDLFVPNSFTPNKDGKNDIFAAKGYGIFRFEMQVFNRYGELIFESNDIQQGWDGTYKGRAVMEGVYPYQIKGWNFKNKEKKFVGKVTLIH